MASLPTLVVVKRNSEPKAAEFGGLFFNVRNPAGRALSKPRRGFWATHFRKDDSLKVSSLPGAMASQKQRIARLAVRHSSGELFKEGRGVTRPRRVAVVAALCGTAALAVWGAAGLARVPSSDFQNTSRGVVEDRPAIA